MLLLLFSTLSFISTSSATACTGPTVQRRYVFGRGGFTDEAGEWNATQSASGLEVSLSGQSAQFSRMGSVATDANPVPGLNAGRMTWKSTTRTVHVQVGLTPPLVESPQYLYQAHRGTTSPTPMDFTSAAYVEPTESGALIVLTHHLEPGTFPVGGGHVCFIPVSGEDVAQPSLLSFSFSATPAVTQGKFDVISAIYRNGKQLINCTDEGVDFVTTDWDVTIGRRDLCGESSCGPLYGGMYAFTIEDEPLPPNFEDPAVWPECTESGLPTTTTTTTSTTTTTPSPETASPTDFPPPPDTTDLGFPTPGPPSPLGSPSPQAPPSPSSSSTSSVGPSPSVTDGDGNVVSAGPGDEVGDSSTADESTGLPLAVIIALALLLACCLILLAAALVWRSRRHRQTGGKADRMKTTITTTTTHSPAGEAASGRGGGRRHRASSRLSVSAGSSNYANLAVPFGATDYAAMPVHHQGGARRSRRASSGYRPMPGNSVYTAVPAIEQGRVGGGGGGGGVPGNSYSSVPPLPTGSRRPPQYTVVPPDEVPGHTYQAMSPSSPSPPGNGYSRIQRPIRPTGKSPLYSTGDLGR